MSSEDQEKHLDACIIDEKVMTFDKVIGGGGEINKLLEISPAETKRLTMDEVKDTGKCMHSFDWQLKNGEEKMLLRVIVSET